MKNIYYLIITALLFISCESNDAKKAISEAQNQDTVSKDNIVEKDTLTKEEVYCEIMKTKNISLYLIGDCEDALDDSTHEHYTAYIDNEIITDSSITVDFKFISVCCMEFLGDYFIQNDTLFFEYEQVNDEMCACLCWYRFKLKIENIKTKFDKYVIRMKRF